MATPKEAEDYGGGIAIADEEPVENAQGQLSAVHYQRLTEDTAQMTRTSCKAIVKWTTKSSGAVGTVVSMKGQLGDTAPFFPTIARSGAGLYTLTFAADYPDGLGEDETTGFYDAHSHIASLSERGDCPSTASGAVVQVNLRTTADALSDFTADSTVIVTYIY